MKYLKYTLYVVLLAVVGIACEVNSSEFPVDFDEVRNPDNTGGFLRVVNLEGGVFNVVDLANQQITLTLEADDAENGGQLESVEFFVGFRDNVAGNTGNVPDTESPTTLPDPIRTFQASDFTVNEDSGLPRVTTTFTSEELLNALDLEEDDIGINSTILLRWTLNLSNGNSFNAQNTGGNVTGGAFFSSPFAQNIVQSLAIPENQFAGTYTLTQDAQTAGGAVGAIGDGWLFGPDATATVELSVDPDNPLNGRVFTVDDGGYLDGAGFGTAIDPINIAFTIDPVSTNNFTTVTNQAGTGLSNAGTNILLGAPEDVALEGSWDETDDTQFTLTIVEDVLNAFATPNPISFTFTRQ